MLGPLVLPDVAWVCAEGPWLLDDVVILHVHPIARRPGQHHPSVAVGAHHTRNPGLSDIQTGGWVAVKLLWGRRGRARPEAVDGPGGAQQGLQRTPNQETVYLVVWHLVHSYSMSVSLSCSKAETALPTTLALFHLSAIQP